MTEGWVSRELYCPRCGALKLFHLSNNQPVADFDCPVCASQFELKSKAGNWSDRVNDGAYATLIERISSDTNPDWLFMGYDKDDYTVRHLFVVPKHFFTPTDSREEKTAAFHGEKSWMGGEHHHTQLSA